MTDKAPFGFGSFGDSLGVPALARGSGGGGGGRLSAANFPGDQRTASGAGRAGQSSAQALSPRSLSISGPHVSSTSPATLQAPVAQSGPAPQSTKAADSEEGWTADTSSAAMRELVAKRAQIFELQRTGRDLSLQALCFEKVSAAVKKYKTSETSTHQSAFRSYAAFCGRMDVPVFPITNALFALWMFNKCSTSDGHFRTYKAGLSLAVDVAYPDWKDQPLYQELCRFDPNAAALNEFMEERRLMYHSKPKSKTATLQLPRAKPLNVAGTKRALRTESDMDTDKTTSSDDGQSNSCDDDKSTSSDDDDDDDDSDYEGGPARTLVEGSTNEAGRGAVNTPIPGLPTADDEFASEIDVFKACVAALVPVFGTAATMQKGSSTSWRIRCNRANQYYLHTPEGQCPWVAVARKVNNVWKIDYDTSRFQHTHGPCKEILADPSWRPKVRNPHAREALGLPLKADKKYRAPPAGKVQPQQQPEKNGQPLQKKKRVEGRSESAQSSVPARAAGAAAYIGPSTPTSVPPASTLVHPASGTHISKPRIRPPAISKASPDQPHPSSSTAGPSPASPQLSDTLVRTFCAGLNPSLVSLAPALLSAGVDSLEAFISLRAFHPDILEHFLNVLREEWNSRCEADPSLAPISRLQLNFFSQRLRA